MSYPTHNDPIVSPQTTGPTNPTATLSSNLEHQQNGIEPNPYQSPVPAYNEKPPLANPDAQYPTATPQQEPQNFYGTEAKQSVPSSSHPQSYPQNNAAPAGQNPNNYQTATPLYGLQQGSVPVDCPVCGVRELTRTEFVSGGTTHVSALLCCLCLCLGCIPYMASWFKDCEHSCGHCGALLAVWHRSGSTEVIAHGRS